MNVKMEFCELILANKVWPSSIYNQKGRDYFSPQWPKGFIIHQYVYGASQCLFPLVACLRKPSGHQNVLFINVIDAPLCLSPSVPPYHWLLEAFTREELLADGNRVYSCKELLGQQPHWLFYSVRGASIGTPLICGLSSYSCGIV